MKGNKERDKNISLLFSIFEKALGFINKSEPMFKMFFDDILTEEERTFLKKNFMETIK